MNSRIRLIVLAAVVAMPCVASAAALASTDPPGRHVPTIAQGNWGTAQKVPGLSGLNRGDFAQFLSMSCASAGNCTAGGTYRRSGATQAFVVSEVNGTWGTGIEVPGIAVLNTGGLAQVYSVSCAPAGGCSVGGLYQILSTRQDLQAFVDSES